ncbi:MAG: polysaccharide biosynthesis tyrosine autokinase [Thermoanaerobaculia bacterium]|nr:polysaccharide biosynthesis tyrosine autokinase [Thermoanaerobaculia bacterium]
MREPATSSDSQLPQVFGETALSTERARPEFRWEQERSFSLEHVVVALLRRKWVLIAVTLLVTAAAAIRSYQVEPLYRAAATLQIEGDRSNLVPYQGFESPLQPWQYIDTQIQRLTSPGFHQQLTEILGRPPNGRLAAAQVGNTMLVTVSFTSPDPEEAAEVANIAAEQFIENHLSKKVEASGRATSFLQQQLDDLQNKVHESEAAVLRYAREKSIVNLGDRETMARSRLTDIGDEVSAAESRLFDLRTQLDVIEAGGTEGLPEDLRSGNLEGIEQRLRQIELELAGLSVRFGPEWPAVKKLEQERVELEDQHQAELATIATNLRKRFEMQQAVHQKLVAELGAQRSTVDRLSENLIEYEILQRESDLNKQLYDGLLQRLKEGGIAESLKTDNIEFVYRAAVPASPISPNRERTILQGLILGLFLGLGAVALLELLDNTVKTVEDVTQRMGLPALGMIPAHRGERRAGRRWFRRRLRAREEPSLAFEPGASGMSAQQEAYRSLRTAILLSHSGTPPQVILVTSALPQDGKSTTAINMAVSLAQTGARTVIIDMDLRNSSVARGLGMEAEQGMSTYLSGNSDLASQIRETPYPNLFIVPAGPHPPNPAELIGSSRMETGMQLLREYFTYVIVDSPPCLGLSDPLLLSTSTDGVILLARSGRTPRRAVLRAVDTLEKVGATFLGVLVNGVRAESRVYGYTYGGYGRYYGRYYGNYHRSEADSARKSA